MSKGTETWKEPETTIIRGVSNGGFGGEPVAVDSKNGKVVRVRPLHWDSEYPRESLPTFSVEVGGNTLTQPPKAAPPFHALAYKKRTYSDNRVKGPLLRVDWEPGGDPAKINAQNRGKSKFKRITWEEALDILEGEIRRIHEQYGESAILAIGEDGHAQSKMIHQLGGNHINFLMRLGEYTREVRTPDSVEGFYWGAKHVWGLGLLNGLGMVDNGQGAALDATLHTEMIVYQGGDIETTQNYGGQWMSRLLQFWLKSGKQFVVIDPFCNYTSVCHDEMKWIPILPGTDAALDFGIMYVWITENLFDKEYVDTHVVGFDKFKDYIMGEEDGVVKDPAWASERCGVPEWTIKALAREWGRKVTSIGHFCGNHQRGPYSHEPGRTEAYKLAMQGLGAPGVNQLSMGDSAVVRQPIKGIYQDPIIYAPNAIAFMPSEHNVPRTMVHHAILDGQIKWWGTPQISFSMTDEQFDVYEYPNEEEDGVEIRMTWSEKPCNQVCWNGGFLFQEAMQSEKLEFVVTNHPWLENDSLFADLVLPVSTVLEESDIIGSSQLCNIDICCVQDAAIEPLGESMSDYDISVAIGERFGLKEDMTSGMDVEQKKKAAFESSKLAKEVSWEEFKEKGYFVPGLGDEWKQLKPNMRNFYDDPESFPLPTPSGKIEFYSEALEENFPDDKERQPMAKWVIGGPASEGWTHDETLWGERCKKYPLLLNSSTGRWRFHAQNDDNAWQREIPTFKVTGKDGYLYEPIWFNPGDAAERGIEDGDIVKMFNDRGTILVGAKLSERIMPGTVKVDKGSRSDPISSRLDRGGNSNLLSPEGPISQHCWGFVVTAYLVDVAKVTDAEMEQWKAEYPEAFNRAYNPASGSHYAGWVEGA